MSERKKVTVVSKEELEKQNEIIKRLRQRNEIGFHKIGRQQYMHVITYGCQQNNADSEKIKGMLGSIGYINTEMKEEADIIVLNTCCVRENAELKLFGNLGAIKKLKENNPELIVCVCG